MLAEAKAKLQTEIEANKNNPYVQYIGKFLFSHLEDNPEDASKIMAVDKTVAKSLDEMRKSAEKKKVGNMAMLTPDEGLAIVFKYFGIGSNPAAFIPTAKVAAPAASSFSVSLDDYL